MAAVEVAMEMAGLDGLGQLRIGIWESHQESQEWEGERRVSC